MILFADSENSVEMPGPIIEYYGDQFRIGSEYVSHLDDTGEPGVVYH